MKRWLNIAAALLHDPELILLDEPTVGVDPQSRNAIFENLEELKRRGKTLVYTTHYMEEAERLRASENLLAGLAAMPGISAVRGTAGGVRFDTADFGANLARALESIAGQGARVTSVKSGQTSLEDVFIALTGHALRDGPLADAP